MNLVPLPHYSTARTVNFVRPFGTTASSEANDSAAQKSKTYFLRMPLLRRIMIRLFFSNFVIIIIIGLRTIYKLKGAFKIIY